MHTFANTCGIHTATSGHLGLVWSVAVNYLCVSFKHIRAAAIVAFFVYAYHTHYTPDTEYIQPFIGDRPHSPSTQAELTHSH